MVDDPKPPAGAQGQDDPSPDDPKGGKRGQEGDSPADAQGQGEVAQKAKSYDELLPKFTNLSKEKGRLTEMAKEYGYGEDELEEFVGDAITELKAVHQKKKSDADGELPEPDEDKESPSGLSEKIIGHINTAARFSLDAKKDSQFNAFLHKHPDFDESLREDLDKEIDGLLEENPKALKSGNWYDKALKSQMIKSDDFLTKIETKAVEKENKRLQNLKDQELVTGGAKAGGVSKSLEDELKERLTK